MFLALLAASAAAQWDNTGYDYRRQVTFTEPAGVARTSDHIRFAVGLQEFRSTGDMALYCGGSQMPLETHVLSMSGGWATSIQAVAELDFTADEVKDCYVYYDADGGGTMDLTVAGWDTAGQTGVSGCNVVDITPSSTDCYAHYNALNYYGSDIVICGGTDYIKLNGWCYFKAPSTTNEQFRVWSDDGSVLYMEDSAVVTDDSCHSPRWSSYGYRDTDAGRFYAMRVYYAEQGGQARIQPVYDGDNVFDTECYGFLGDEWTVSVSVGSEELRNQPPAQTGSSVNPDPGGWFEGFTYSVDFTEPDGDSVDCVFSVYRPSTGTWEGIGSDSGTTGCSLTHTPFSCSDVGVSQWSVAYDDGTHAGTWGPWSGPTLTGECCDNPIDFEYTLDYSGTAVQGRLYFDKGNWDPGDYHCFSIDDTPVAALNSYTSEGVTITNATLMSPGAHTLTVTLSASDSCLPDSLNQWNVSNINFELTYY